MWRLSQGNLRGYNMVKYFCDKCGKQLPTYSNFDFKESQTATIYFNGRHSYTVNGPNPWHKCLCHECSEKLFDWINGVEGEKDE